ncbi:MAG TPA: hypothetical protein VD928_02250 [Candidatus Paceibacterota bacterium]|nr:hypothetical protein [Candidatus Paceibacterota bacterium]
MLREEERHPLTSVQNRICERQKILAEVLCHYYHFGETMVGYNTLALRVVDLCAGRLLLRKLSARRGDALPRGIEEALSKHLDAAIKKLERESTGPDETDFMILRLIEQFIRSGTMDIIGKQNINESMRHAPSAQAAQ